MISNDLDYVGEDEYTHDEVPDVKTDAVEISASNRPVSEHRKCSITRHTAQVICHTSYVTSNMSHVIYHISHVTRHISYVTSHVRYLMSYVTVSTCSYH